MRTSSPSGWRMKNPQNVPTAPNGGGGYGNGGYGGGSNGGGGYTGGGYGGY